MKKRMLALILCFTMIFSMLPGQVLAEGEEPSTEETQPQVTEPAATDPAETEPEVTEPEATEPETGESEETESGETEETVSEDEPSAQSDLPGGTCGDNASWTFDEATGVLTISGTGDMYDYEFSPNVAPWPGYLVKKVVIEPGITRIGNYAFVNRYNMTDVCIPDTVISIGRQAFSGCSKLEVVLLPQNLTSIEWQAFLNCESLVRITVPEGVTVINEQAFSGCTSLQVATLLGNVTSIGNKAFSNCRGMTAINIPASVTSIGDGAFGSCVSLTKLSIPGSVTAIGNDAFIGCTGLTSVSLPDSITSFGYTVFKGCTGLKEVTLPGTFSSVDANTFKDCNALTRVYIPKSYTTVNSLFKSASSLADIYYGGSPADWLTVDRDNLPGTAAVFYNCTGLGDPDVPRGPCGSTCSWSFDEATGKLTIEGTYSTYTFTQTPSSAYDREVPWKDYLHQIRSVEVREVTSIGAYAFADAINLASVSMDSVTYVGDYAFRGCASLESVSLSASLSSLRAFAFAGSGITHFSVPEYVRSLSGTFQDCSALKAVYIPTNTSSIDSTTFQNCASLTDIYYGGYESDWAAAFSGTLSEQVTVHYRSSGMDVPGTPEILTGECGYSATWTFDEATGLLTISGSGKIFDFGRLTDSQGIETGEWRDSPWKSFVREIKSVRIEEGITYIGNESFKNAVNLAEVYAPAVTSVGKYAFSGASSLKTADIPSLRAIDAYGFDGCKALTALPLPENFSWFKDYTFRNCGFTEFSVPAKVSSLPFLFDGCADLRAVFIPSAVKMIGNTTFWDCTSLTDIYYEGSQEDWAAIVYSVKSPDEYNNATIHYNCTGLFDPAVPAAQQEVRYYSNYDADAMAACFGGGLPNCFVTEETDAAFTVDPTALVGQYVLVEYSRDDNGIDTLISMTALETGVTTITTISSGGITIGENVYPMDGDIEALEIYLGETVLYHTLNGELVDIEILQWSQGYLSSWIESTQRLIICPDKTMLQDEIFPLSSYADEQTVSFLSGLSSMPGIAVNFCTDALGNVMHLELGGYSAINNGWCFPNSHFGFGYTTQYFIPPERFEEVFGPSYVATANAADQDVFLSMYMRPSNPTANPWGGNCHGMSMTSILFYLDMLPWENYSNNFSTVNLYHHQLSPQNDPSASTLFAIAGTNTALTKMIERYQILQKNTNHGYSMENSTYAYLSEYETDDLFKKHIPGGNYIQRVLDTIWESEEPLLVTMQATDSAHAVVIRTDKLPVNVGNGWHRVYIYDPNTPYIAQKYVDQTGLNPYGAYLNRHSADRYIELNPTLNVWRYNTTTMEIFAPEYWGSDANGNVLYKEREQIVGNIVIESCPHQLWICPLSSNIPLSFNGSEEWIPRWEAETTIIHVAGNSSFQVLSEEGSMLCQFADGIPLFCADGVVFMPYAGITESGTGNLGGTLSLPGYDFRIQFEGGGDISVIGPEFVYNIASDHPANISVAMDIGTTTTESTDGGEILMQLTHIYSNSEYTSVVADGTLEAGDSVTLTLDGNSFTGSLTGSGSLELLTDNHNAPESRPLHNLTEGSGTVEIADVTAAQDTIRVALDEAVFAGTDTLYADGQPCAIIQSETGLYVDVPEGTALLVAYTWHVGDETDIHTKYPTGMQVYRIVNGETGYTAEYIPELDNLLQYSGASIRIVGVKGIRMITSITKGNKSALTGEGLAGYTLEEYGTALCWATDLAPGEDLVLGKEYTRSNYAYKKGVADPIFAQTAELTQYTNVLVGFSDDQCIPDIVMRPYIILSEAEGNQVTLYGGSIHRSIGYIAWQNRNVFQPGSASYDYVWGIIHHVYGDRFDEDYKG